MKKCFIGIALLLFSVSAFAKPHTLNWSWPTADCDAITLNPNDWVSGEIIYDVDPMPMPSDTGGPCSATNDPNGPSSSISVPITTPVTELELNLQPGVTYYARIRVCYVTTTNCSAWSTELEFVVPRGKPQRSTWN